MTNENVLAAGNVETADEGWWELVLAEEHRYSGLIRRGFNAKPEARKEAERVSALDEKTVDWHLIKDLYMKDRIVELTVTLVITVVACWWRAAGCLALSPFRISSNWLAGTTFSAVKTSKCSLVLRPALEGHRMRAGGWARGLFGTRRPERTRQTRRIISLPALR